MIPPDPTTVKQTLYKSQRLCATVAIRYTEAVDDCYLGIRKPNTDGTPKAKGAYSDPTGDIATSTHHSHIRSNTAQAAKEVDIAHKALVKALKLLEDHLTDDSLAVGK